MEDANVLVLCGLSDIAQPQRQHLLDLMHLLNPQAQASLAGFMPSNLERPQPNALEAQANCPIQHKHSRGG